MRLCLLVRLILLTWFVGVAEAQSPKGCSPPSEYALLRQDEDYSELKNPACRQDFWDPLKFIPFGLNGYLTIGGEAREWYEGFRNANWGRGPQDHNGYLLQRLSLYGDWHISSRVRFFGQLSSSIEAGRNGGPAPIMEAKLWVEQGFADVGVMESGKASLVLRLGRQEYEFGSGRLVDSREGPNVRLAFDGADAILKAGSWHVDAFAARPVVNNIAVFDDPPNHGTLFWGAYGVRPLPSTHGGNIDVYYLGIDNKQATFSRGTAQEVRHTVGTRFWGEHRALVYNWEAMGQWGSYGKVGIQAWAVGTHTGYNVRSIHSQPQIGFNLGTTSGDSGRRSNPLGTFNPLFPTGIYFGEGGVNLNGPSNMLRIGPSVTFHLRRTLSLILDDDFFWRKSLEDGVYGLGVNLLWSALDNRNRYIGSQPSAGMYWQANRHIGLAGAYTHFSVGPFLTQRASPGRNVDYAAIWASYKF
jgi:Alginate export